MSEIAAETPDVASGTKRPSSIAPHHGSPVVAGQGARVQTAVLALSECVAVSVSLTVLAYTTYDILDQGLPTIPLIWLVGTPLTLLFLAIVSFGTYERGHISDLDALRPRFIIGAAAAGTVSYLLLYLLAPFWVSPLYIATSIVVMAATLMVTRAIAVTVTRSGHFRRRVLVIGSEGQADAIRALCEAPGSGTEFVGRYDLERRLPGHLGYYVEHRDVAEIVIADPQDRSALPMGALLDCKMNGARVHDVAEFYERESGRVDLDRVSVDRFVFGTGFNLTHSELLLKRAIDILGSFAGLIVLSPLLAATALAIRWHDGGPVFYRQTRVGYRGARFEILKFRSMRTDAEKFGAQWASEDDPRITPIGRFIRKCRIDELPQLVNILLGDMSIVGPRPERPVFVADLNRSIRHYDDRHRMKPGLTGWAQINDRYGASVDDARSKLAYDLYYLKHFSLWLDLLIMLKTIRVVVWTDSAR